MGAALAADISGNWSGVMQTGGDPYPLAFVFKVEGAKLTGTVVGPEGQPLPLTEGKVTGDKVSFVVHSEVNGGPAKFVCEGAVKGEEIALNIMIEGGQDFGTSMLKRAK